MQTKPYAEDYLICDELNLLDVQADGYVTVSKLQKILEEVRLKYGAKTACKFVVDVGWETGEIDIVCWVKPSKTRLMTTPPAQGH